jgi:signal transduction histidine kinase
MWQSLRSQFLLPLLAAMALAVAAIGWLAYSWADATARRTTEQHLTSVMRQLTTANFPLTANVLSQLQSLSGLDIGILIGRPPRVLTTPGLEAQLLTGKDRPWFAWEDTTPPRLSSPSSEANGIHFIHGLALGGNRCDVAYARNDFGLPGDSKRIFVLAAPHLEQVRIRQQAIWLPLAVGAASTLAIGFVAVALAHRFEQRIQRLRLHVARLAQGANELLPPEGPEDEFHRLTVDLNHMTESWKQLQTVLDTNQRVALINQIAGGMAHQLRNTLTGARLAIQLYQQRAGQTQADDHDLEVALAQLRLAEQSLQSLLQVRTGIEEQPSPPIQISDLIAKLTALLLAKATHQAIDFQSVTSEAAAKRHVPDGQAILGALLNLGLNAVEAAPDHGEVSIEVEYVRPAMVEGLLSSGYRRGAIRFLIRDNGDGPDPACSAEIFETFVTTKPEGVGLGLPMALRVSQRLGGNLTWRRVGQTTEFEMEVPEAFPDS